MISRVLPPVLLEEAGRLVVIIRNEQPIDLLDFTSSLSALAREHEAKLRRDRPKLPLEETKLLITNIRQGSTIIEMVPVLAPFVSTMEIVNTASEFVKHMAALLNVLKEPQGRLADTTTVQLKNVLDTVQVVAADSGGELELLASIETANVRQHLVIRKSEAQHIIANATEQRREIEQKSAAVHERVLMRLFQTSVDSAKVNKRASEKGIVERVDPAPHTLVYVSELAGQQIKEEILRPGGNPYEKGFIVDLDVETIGGRPRLYRILALHDVIDLAEDD